MGLKVYDRVLIKDGLYEGEVGNIIKIFPNGTCVIHLDEDSNVIIESNQISQI